MPEDLPLEPDLIKVLASDTRREVLRLLRERRMTVTELARELDLQKATIHEHLGKLTDAGLVERDDEDDRLWVYYELTGEGKRILNPQRTRFYLVVGIGVLSVLVLALAAALFFQVGTGPGADQPPSTGALDVQLAGEQTVTSSPQLQATVQGVESNERIEAFLLTQEEAQQLQQGEPTQGIRLDATPLAPQATPEAQSAVADADEEDTAPRESTQQAQTTLETTRTIPAGTYRLYVRTAGGEDNLHQMPTVQVSNLTLGLSTSTLYLGLSGPLNITLTEDQTPTQGRIMIAPAGEEGIQLSLPLQDGHARLLPKQIDRLAPGDYQVRWAPSAQGASIPLDDVRVRQPSIRVSPQHAPSQQPLNVTVQASGIQGDLLVLKAPEVDGATTLEQRRDGRAWRLQLDPTDPDRIHIEIGRLAEKNITLYTPLTAHIAERGDDWVLTLQDASENPVSDAAVHLDNETLGTTNPQGELPFPPPGRGSHMLSIEPANGQTTHRVFAGGEQHWTPIAPTMTLQANLLDPRASPQVTLQATLDVENGSQLPATLSIQINQHTVESQPFELTPQGRQTVRVQLAGPLSPTSTLHLEATHETPLTLRFSDTLQNPNESTATDEASPTTAALQGEPVGTAEGAQDTPTTDDASGADRTDGSGVKEPVSPDGSMSPSAEAPGPSIGLLLIGMGSAAGLWILRRRG